MSGKETLLPKVSRPRAVKSVSSADTSEAALAVGSDSQADSSATLRLALSIKNVCKATDLSKSFIYEQIAIGVLPSVKAGRRTLIPIDDLRKWLSEHRRARNSAPESLT
jgi:excisionase family DNA binding protein